MPALKAIISADSRPLQNEFATVERLARQTGVRMQQAMSKQHVGNSGALRETMVLLREMGRGNWSRVPGSASILVGQLNILKFLFRDNAVEAAKLATKLEAKAIASNTAAAAAKKLAEGQYVTLSTMRNVTVGELAAARADQVRAESAMTAAGADQAKAVAARQAAVAMEQQGAAARFAITPLGWVGIALVAVGTAVALLVGRMLQLQREQKNLSDLVTFTAAKFSEQASAMKEAEVASQKFEDWLKKLGEAEEGFAEKTEGALKALREKSRLQKELAQAQGKPKKDLAQMDIEEARQELDIVNKALAQAKEKAAQDRVAAQEANSFANDGGQRKADVKELSERSTTAAKIVDAIAEKVKGGQVSEIDYSVPAGQVGRYKTRAMDATDTVPVEVDGKEYRMSLQQAKTTFKTLSDKGNDLAREQTQLDDALEDKKKQAEKSTADEARLTKQQRETQEALKLKEQYLPQIAAAEKKEGKIVTGHLTEYQRQGAYTGPAAYIDTAKNSERHLAAIRKHLEKGSKGSGGGFNAGKVNYGGGSFRS